MPSCYLSMAEEVTLLYKARQTAGSVMVEKMLLRSPVLQKRKTWNVQWLSGA